MAIKQEGQRGRPIEWEKLFKSYKSKTKYWSKTYKTKPIDEITSASAFKEIVLVTREKYGLNSVQAVRMLSQQSGLGATLKQINTYINSARDYGIQTDIRTAIKVFERLPIEDGQDIIDIMAKNYGDDWDTDDLKDAGLMGLVSLTQINYLLAHHAEIIDGEGRKTWIAQNIFGSN